MGNVALAWDKSGSALNLNLSKSPSTTKTFPSFSISLPYNPPAIVQKKTSRCENFAEFCKKCVA